MQINAGPLSKQAYKLCLAIEELPASEEATNLSIQASKLAEGVSFLEAGIRELIKDQNAVATIN